jgi:hypothetical protein
VEALHDGSTKCTYGPGFVHYVRVMLGVQRSGLLARATFAIGRFALVRARCDLVPVDRELNFGDAVQLQPLLVFA